MAEKKNVKTKINWTKAQLYGFYAIIVLSATFWSGVLLGNYSANTAKNELEAVKVQAVEAYKAELKTQK